MDISVIIPVYNAAQFVADGVSSIVNQKHVSEVILVEDGSKDESLSVCKELEQGNSKVVLIQHPDGKNLGAGAARNLGVKRSCADLIAFLDADDIALPNRFDYPLEVLVRQSDIDGVYEAIGTMFENDDAREKWDSLNIGDLTTVRRILHPKELFYSLVMYEAGHFSLDGLVVKRSLFSKVGGFNECLRLHQDTDFCIKASAVGNLVPGRLENAVAIRRVHSGNRFVRHREDALQCRLLQWRELNEWTKSTKQGKWKRLIVRYQLFWHLEAHYRRKRNYPMGVFYHVLNQLMRYTIISRKRLFGTASF